MKAYPPTFIVSYSNRIADLRKDISMVNKIDLMNKPP